MSSTLRVFAVVLVAASLLLAQEKPAGDDRRHARDARQRTASGDHPRSARAGRDRRGKLSGRRQRDSRRLSRHGARAGAHGVPRMLRSCPADQISAIFAQLGGYGNADTQQNITQYFTTVPAADLDIALRVDAACMRDIEDCADRMGAGERAPSNRKWRAICRIRPTNS